MIVQHHLLMHITVDFQTSCISSEKASNRVRVDILPVIRVPKYDSTNGITQNNVIFRVSIENPVRSGVVVRKIILGRIENLLSLEDRFPI